MFIRYLRILNRYLRLMLWGGGLWAMPLLVWALDTAVAERQSLPDTLTVDALIEPVHRATLTAQTSGQVTEVNFDVNDTVKKGAVLVRLNDAEHRSALAQANAELREARAHLNGVQSEYNRVKASYDRKAIAAVEMDRVNAELRVAQARVGSVEAAIKRAEEQLQYTVLKAPYSGIVLERHIELGESAAPGRLIMSGYSFDQLRAVTSIPQSRAAAVRQQDQASIIVNLPDTPTRYKVEKITVLPQADTQSHNFRVRLELPKNIPDLKPGMFVKAEFILGQQARLMLPHQAVAYRGEVRAVYPIDEQGKLTMRQVRLGKIIGDQIEILSGLSEGERVALDP
ncbi:efflux RND transporter periplasmic adaptor subunit, partial [Thioflexithrix psekupsensis]